MVMRQDIRQPHQDLMRRLHQQELDLVCLKRNLELANLELERTQKEQRELLVNTAHELRTPLNAILSFLRLVLDDLCDSPEEVRQFVRSAYECARGMLDLINEHLDNVSLEAGKLDVQLIEVNVATVFAQVEKLTLKQVDQKVRLTFRPPRTRVQVRADPVKLIQILLSLVTMALKWNSQGEVRVQARSWRDLGHVQFQVRLLGLGLSPENQANLVHQFYLGEGSADLENGGKSLGWVSCKTLVEYMGGQIWLSRPEGQEIAVCFSLPLVVAQPLYWRRTTDRDRGLQVQGLPAGPLILLVEDNPKVLDKMARILQKHGYQTAFAVTADDGLEGAKRLWPDLISIDLGLPVRPQGELHSGLDLYEALRQDSHLARIPVILVTGHDPTLTHTPQKLPPVLNKPFRAQQLLDQVVHQLATRDGLSF